MEQAAARRRCARSADSHFHEHNQEHKVNDTPHATEAPALTPGITPAGQTPTAHGSRPTRCTTLQRTVSDHPGEHAWIVHVQVSELYWMLIIKEIQTAQRFLRGDNLPQACRALKRIVGHQAPLDAIWRSIDWMTPNDLLAILSRAVATHGKDTALQGWTYRQMVYLLGIKQAVHLQHFEPQPAALGRSSARPWPSRASTTTSSATCSAAE